MGERGSQDSKKLTIVMVNHVHRKHAILSRTPTFLVPVLLALATAPSRLLDDDHGVPLQELVAK